MIGLKAIASYIPEGYERNADKQAKFGFKDGFLETKIGVERVARKAAGEETSDMCVRAFEALHAKTGIVASDIDCIIVCTQNPDGRGIPHTSAIVQGKLGVPPACATFDISLGCSGYIYGLSIAKSFMQANGLACGLLMTADPYSKIVDPDDKNTVLLFGDAAAASLLAPPGNGETVWVPTHTCFQSLGQAGDALKVVGDRLVMNGRAVFAFSVTNVPAQVAELLQEAALTVDDIDLFCFHQGSRYIVDSLARRMALPQDKVPLNMRNQGNTVSSSLPILFEPFIDDPRLNRVLFSGFGVGLSVASCLMERRGAAPA